MSYYKQCDEFGVRILDDITNDTTRGVIKWFCNSFDGFSKKAIYFGSTPDNSELKLVVYSDHSAKLLVGTNDGDDFFCDVHVSVAAADFNTERNRSKPLYSKMADLVTAVERLLENSVEM